MMEAINPAREIICAICSLTVVSEIKRLYDWYGRHP